MIGPAVTEGPRREAGRGGTLTLSGVTAGGRTRSGSPADDVAGCFGPSQDRAGRPRMVERAQTSAGTTRPDGAAA